MQHNLLMCQQLEHYIVSIFSGLNKTCGASYQTYDWPMDGDVSSSALARRKHTEAPCLSCASTAVCKAVV